MVLGLPDRIVDSVQPEVTAMTADTVHSNYVNVFDAGLR
jgi:hypothetical protein